VCLDGAITGAKLRLAGIEEFKILLEDEEMFRPIVTGERGDDVGLGRVASMIAMLGELLRIAAARHWRRMRSPVTPVMSLTTKGSCGLICTRAFCTRCT
jgi:hypothetical protein